jgi:alkylhydroperoxidase family enzyme
MNTHGFLGPAPASDGAERLFAADVEDVGYVMNLSRLWAHLPDGERAVRDLLGMAAHAASLTYRQRAVLVTAAAAEFGDAYCALKWGNRLAGVADADIAVGVVRGDDGGLDESERALARWARLVARDPAGVEAADLQPLRNAGFDDSQVFALTLFVAMRLAFATVNDALGVLPDEQLRDTIPAPLLDAVAFGRSLARSEG